MFGENNNSSVIRPSRRSTWAGITVGCLMLSTAALLVSGTVDGLNVFGRRLPDSTPHFSDPPKDEGSRSPERPTPVAPPAVSTRSSAPLPRDRATSVTPARPAAPPVRPPAPPPCAPSGYAAAIDPSGDAVGTALARSLQASDLRARVIELSDGDAERPASLNIARIMAGDGSSVIGRITEGTLLAAQLRVQVRRIAIAEAPMIEVAGNMDLAIVHNNCGAIAEERHRNVFGRSVNATLDDGIRGLGEIFKEKIGDIVAQNVQPGSSIPLPKPAIVLVPDETGYGQCVEKSKSREEALTCLARWEAAASEYHKAAIESAAEIERRDREAGEVVNQQLSSLTSRQAHTPPGMAVVSAKEQAAMYQISLDRLNAEIDQARKMGMDPARLDNLGRQARYLGQALQNRQYADAIETYRRLAGEREMLLDESKGAVLLARAHFQAVASLRVARRAEIDRLWPIW